MIENGNMRAGGNEMNRKARMKKCIVFFLSIAMVLAMSVPAFAAEGGATANMETTPAAAQDNTIADIQSKIDKLPDAGDITSDNVGDVKAQLETIDKAKVGLTDEEISKLKTDKYTVAVEKISKLEQGENADVPKGVAEETVAQIGNTNYTTLQAAFDDLQPGDTVKLMQDVTAADNTPFKINEKGIADKSIVVDLNGHVVAGSNNTKYTEDGSGILQINGSYVNITDTSSGNKGGIYNNCSENVGTTSLMIKATENTAGKVIVSDGICIDTKSSKVKS